MTKVDYLTKERNVNRARVNMTHDNTALLVSHDEALRAEEDTKKRLLNSKKLTLIVDLDQTVIHTTCERTVAEWQADPANPNYEAVKDVQGFQLADDNIAAVASNWYYVKMRPGLKDFFDRLSKLYEMHVYTMATRAYAQAIMKIIDPERKYFGDRILSRDENYTDKLKSLARLFQNTEMVVIIDDRADVWQYSPHLVRVPVFNFFPGAGDINASFLPKQQELVTQSKDKLSSPPAKDANGDDEPSLTVSVTGKPAEPPPAPLDTTNGDLTEIGQQLITMAAREGGEVLEQQAEEQEKVIIAQQIERPLLQQQLMLDKEDAQAEGIDSSVEVQNGDAGPLDPPKIRHSVLNEDDRGLDIVEKHLVQVHRAFYDDYRKAKAVPAGGRIAELKGEKSPKKRRLNETIPDVAKIMPRIKEEVLNGAVVVFSGIIPLGVDIQTYVVHYHRFRIKANDLTGLILHSGSRALAQKYPQASIDGPRTLSLIRIERQQKSSRPHGISTSKSSIPNGCFNAVRGGNMSMRHHTQSRSTLPSAAALPLVSLKTKASTPQVTKTWKSLQNRL
jgi:RNA polymerase II subunit A-like phosphatase